MKKKLFGMILVAALVVSQTVTAFAADSKGTQEVGGTDVVSSVEGAAADATETVVMDAVSASELSQEKKETVYTQIREANGGNVASIINTLGSQAEVLKNIKTLSPVLEVSGVAANSKVTFGFANLNRSEVKALHALHLDLATGLWEVLPAEFAEDGRVVVTFTNGASPVIIVAEEAVHSTRTRRESDNPVSAPAPAAPAAAAGAAGVPTSPKTGTGSDWMLYMGLAAVLLGISGTVLRRTEA